MQSWENATFQKWSEKEVGWNLGTGFFGFSFSFHELRGSSGDTDIKSTRVGSRQPGGEWKDGRRTQDLSSLSVETFETSELEIGSFRGTIQCNQSEIIRHLET